MTLEHMIEFVILTDNGNFHRAADKLFISQSALSKHIKALEQDLGVPLLERNAAGVLLTDFGKMFYPYAKQIMQLHEGYSKEVSTKLNSLSGIVNIGTEYNINFLLRSFKTDNPDFAISLFEAPSFHEVRHGLRNGQYEVAFMLDNEESAREYNSLPAFADELVLAVSGRDSLASSAAPVQVSLLKDRRFILPAENTMLSHIVSKVLHTAGIEPLPICTGIRTPLALNFVAEDIGITLLPRREAEFFLPPNVALLSLDPGKEMKINLYFRKNVELSPGAMFFINYVQNFRRKNADKP